MSPHLDEIRKQISDLRAEMTALENQVRLQIKADLDCSDVAMRLLTARKDMVGLIRIRNQLGGTEVALAYSERFAALMADNKVDT